MDISCSATGCSRGAHGVAETTAHASVPVCVVPLRAACRRVPLTLLADRRPETVKVSVDDLTSGPCPDRRTVSPP